MLVPAASIVDAEPSAEVVSQSSPAEDAATFCGTKPYLLQVCGPAEWTLDLMLSFQAAKLRRARQFVQHHIRLKGRSSLLGAA